MNTKELLELAAKAAGIELFMPTHNGAWLDNTVGVRWNPLTDDGDALRLAVKLGIEYGFGYNADGLIQRVIVDDDLYVVVENNDPYAATRRAITSAAAEIGRMMP